MRRSFVARTVATLLALALPASTLYADAAFGMVQVRGGVMVNGSKIDRTSAVFAGDRLQTIGESAFAITSPEGTVLVPEGSSIIVGKADVELLCGTMLIATARGLGARVGNLSVRPAESNTKFEVSHTVAELRVTAREGGLTISDGRREAALAAGETITAPGGCNSGAVYNASATTKSAAPASSSYAMPGVAVALIAVGVAAGVATAIYYAVRDESPSEP